MTSRSIYLAAMSFSIYADDRQFLRTGSIDNIGDLVHRGEETLAKAKKNFQINGLMLNSAKTQCMFIGSRGSLYTDTG